jgi:hypothetical protein
MYTTPMMFPLDLEGRLHSIQDEHGNTIGTGTREVCELLLHLINKGRAGAINNSTLQMPPPRSNVRSAMAI